MRSRLFWIVLIDAVFSGQVECIFVAYMRLHCKLHRNCYNFWSLLRNDRIIRYRTVHLFVIPAIVQSRRNYRRRQHRTYIYAIYFRFGDSSAHVTYTVRRCNRNKVHGSELIGAQGSNWSSLRDIRRAADRVIVTQTSPLVFNLTLPDPCDGRER